MSIFKWIREKKRQVAVKAILEPVQKQRERFAVLDTNLDGDDVKELQAKGYRLWLTSKGWLVR